MSSEIDASKWLAKNRPAAFNGDGERLRRDFVIFSLLSYFTTNQFDWQLKRITFVGRTAGTTTISQPVSKAHECSAFDEKQLSEKLRNSENVFAGAKLMIISGRPCLPPKTTLQITSTGIFLQNPFCRVSFELEPTSGGVSFVQPGSIPSVAPQMPNGQPRFETSVTGIRAKVERFRLRAQHRSAPLYRDWASRVTQGARDWFESS